jgi:hypothetical protein
MGRGLRKLKQLLDLKETRGYWKLKVEALGRSLWKTSFGKGFGPVVRHYGMTTTFYHFGSTVVLSILFPNIGLDITTLIFGEQFNITKLLVFHSYVFLLLPTSSALLFFSITSFQHAQSMSLAYDTQPFERGN